MNTDGLQCPECYSFGPFEISVVPILIKCETCGHVATGAEFKALQEAA